MHPCASVQSRDIKPINNYGSISVPMGGGDIVVTKLFSLTALFPQPCVNIGRHTLKWSKVPIVLLSVSRAVSKWDAARRKGNDQDQSDQGLPLVARDSWQLLRFKEQSEQEHRIKYVKHVLSQKFNSLEEARKKEEPSTKTRRMESANVHRQLCKDWRRPQRFWIKFTSRRSKS